MTEAGLRAYLLGKLPESEAEQVENRLLEDPDFFSRLEVAEDDLFDAYARGELSEDERDRFIQRFGNDTSRRQFAQAFVTRTAPARVVPFPRRYWMPLAVAATLLVGVYVLPWRNLVQQPAPTDPASDRPAPVASGPVVMRVPLALGTTRSSGGSTTLLIDAKTTVADMTIRLNPADRYAVYSADLRSSAGNIVWGSSALQASQENGDLILHAMVPADHLSAGTYELQVRGGASGSSLDDLGFLAIEVKRVP